MERVVDYHAESALSLKESFWNACSNLIIPFSQVLSTPFIGQSDNFWKAARERQLPGNRKGKLIDTYMEKIIAK